MKIYRRDQFLNLPAGVFYVKACSVVDGVETWGFEGPAVKGNRFLDDDWWFRRLDRIEPGFDDLFDVLDQMKKDGISVPIADYIEHDGLFETGTLFLVFERSDLETVRDLIDAAIALGDPA